MRRIPSWLKVLLLLIILKAMVFFGTLVWLWRVTPDPTPLQRANPQTTSFLQQLCREDCAIEWTPLSEMSPFLPQAVVVAEDIRFFRHHGIDWKSLWAAVKLNITKGRVVWGGSTITQQLAKNLYLSREKTIGRKLRELLLTVKLEQGLTKERILEIYLNVAQWGPSTFGVTAAAQKYFGKRPAELGPLEASYLASILPSPERATQGALHERFTDVGSRIFDLLLQSYLPPIREEAISQACQTRLNAQEIVQTDYLVAKIFGEWADRIVTGKVTRAGLQDLRQILSPEEERFLRGLAARAGENGDPFHGTEGDEGIGYRLYLFLATLRQKGYCLSTTAASAR